MSEQRYGLKDLPVNIELDFLVEKDNTPAVLSFIGWLLFIVGALFIVFGPEKIYYNTRTGMTFFQILQAYPGPIASIGALIAGVANILSKKTKEDQVNYILLSVFDSLDFGESDLPEGKKLDLKFIDNKTITIDMIAIEQTLNKSDTQSETIDNNK